MCGERSVCDDAKKKCEAMRINTNIVRKSKGHEVMYVSCISPDARTEGTVTVRERKDEADVQGRKAKGEDRVRAHTQSDNQTDRWQVHQNIERRRRRRRISLIQYSVVVKKMCV